MTAPGTTDTTQLSSGWTGEAFADALHGASLGEGWAYRWFHEQLAPALAAFAGARSVHDPDPVANEILLRVFQSLDRFAGDRAAMLTWVFAVARSVLQQGDRPGDEVRPVWAEPLDDLGAEAHDLLLVRIIAGLDLDQASRVMGMPLSAVRALQRRGLRQLDTAIRNHLDGLNPGASAAAGSPDGGWSRLNDDQLESLLTDPTGAANPELVGHPVAVWFAGVRHRGSQRVLASRELADLFESRPLDGGPGDPTGADGGPGGADGVDDEVVYDVDWDAEGPEGAVSGRGSTGYDDAAADAADPVGVALVPRFARTRLDADAAGGGDGRGPTGAGALVPVAPPGAIRIRVDGEALDGHTPRLRHRFRPPHGDPFADGFDLGLVPLPPAQPELDRGTIASRYGDSRWRRVAGVARPTGAKALVLASLVVLVVVAGGSVSWLRHRNDSSTNTVGSIATTSSGAVSPAGPGTSASAPGAGPTTAATADPFGSVPVNAATTVVDGSGITSPRSVPATVASSTSTTRSATTTRPTTASTEATTTTAAPTTTTTAAPTTTTAPSTTAAPTTTTTAASTTTTAAAASGA